MSDQNPLLQPTLLPQFDQFNVQDVKPAIDHALAHCREINEQVKSSQASQWSKTIGLIEDAEQQLSLAMSMVSQLNSVQNTEALRQAYEYCLEQLSAYGSEVGQDQQLLKVYQQVRQQDAHLTTTQKKVIDDAILSFQLAGVDLPESKREAFRQRQMQLAQLQNQFENHVLDATMAWHYHTDDVQMLAGLPEPVIQAAADKAKQQDKTGYVLGLDMPTYLAVMQQANVRKLRQTFYEAFNTRACAQGDYPDYDNGPIMAQILKLRQQQAADLGYAHYADVSLATKMADDTQTVFAFLEKLATYAKPKAQKEFDDLTKFAQSQGLSDDTLQAWDVAYYSQQYKKALFDFTDETLRDYFPLPTVLQGLFDILRRIYGLTITQQTDFPQYEPTLQLYRFDDAQGNVAGYIYLDLYARDNKRGGAWMDECRIRHRDQQGHLQLPVAYVNCNFRRPSNNDVATLTHQDVVTLFHEFGHALHHILTKVDIASVAGINGVEWDAVECPSQLMENFCWHPTGLAMMSQHVTTGQPLPDDLIDKIRQSQQFQSGMAMVRQLEFALFDMKLHCQAVDSEAGIQSILQEVRQQVAVIPYPSKNYFAHGFSHIFGGGYAAGYYSYKWAEVLSSDLFALFEAESTILSAQVGQSILNKLLSQGGSQPFKTLFMSVYGGEPDVGPLLRHSGIEAS